MAGIAFLDIDTQVDFMKSDGKLYVAGAEGIIPNLRRLIKAAQEFNIPVVGSVDAHAEDDPEFERFPPHCVKGTPGQNKIAETSTENMRFIPMDGVPEELDISPPGPVILEKNSYNVFDSPHAEAVLDATGADRFAVFGVATDYCVNDAAEGLLQKGYEVLLVTDAIRAVDPVTGDKTIEELKSKGVKLVTTADVLAEVSK